jgi:hypothetical protein
MTDARLVPAYSFVFDGVVDELRDQDADGGGQLEHDVEGAAVLGGGHLGQIQGDRLIRESDTESQEDAANDKHGDMHGACQVERDFSTCLRNLCSAALNLVHE